MRRAVVIGVVGVLCASTVAPLAHAAGPVFAAKHAKKCKAHFTAVKAPSPGGRAYGGYQAVSVAGPKDAFAVGTLDNVTAGRFSDLTGLLAEYTGKKWKAAGINLKDSLLDGVGASSSTNAWAVGEDESDQLNPAPIVLHKDNHGWHSAAKVVDKTFSPGAAATSGPDDVFLGGNTMDYSKSDDGVPVIYHYNGKKWSTYSFPKSLAYYFISDIQVFGKDSAVVVGNATNDADFMSVTRSFAALWNGKTWKQIHYGKKVLFQRVSATSAHDVWATGETANFDSKKAYHHSSGWKAKKVTSGSALGVSEQSKKSIWFAGATASNQAAVRFSDGSGFRSIPTDPPSAASSTLEAIDARTPALMVAVGHDQIGADRKGLIEQAHC